MKYKIMDGNEACSYVSYKFTEVAGIYPITPASPMAEKVDVDSGNGLENFFGTKVKVVEMQSEAGAAGMVHGSLQAGCLTTTFTASQGLLLMIPNMYKIAGEQLPCVINVAARSLATHALSIFGDHQDIYAARSTGFAFLASSTPQQVMDLTGVSHLSALNGEIPFVNFFDGFRTSHELAKVKLIDLDKVKSLINQEKLDKFRNKSILFNKNTRGTAQNDDIYFQNMEVRNKYYDELPDIVNKYMESINEITGEDYKPFNYYGSKNAKYVIVAMGSVCSTIKETINELNKVDDIYGMIEVHLYRPFSAKYLLQAIPVSTEVISVLDRTKEPGSGGEPLYKDVVEVLSSVNKDIKIFGGRYGLSSKNTNPGDIASVYQAMKNNKIFNNFTIGIVDDVTNLSLDRVDIKLNNDVKEFLIYGYGSDGMVSASKDLIKIVGDNTNAFVQGYFQYDSKKSGGVTKSHLRIGKNEILSEYYVENSDLVVVSKESYLKKYNCLSTLKDNGILLINTDKENGDLINLFNDENLTVLKNKNINLYTINASGNAMNAGLHTKISTIMETAIFYLSNIVDFEFAKDKVIENINKKFLNKGNNLVDKNIEVVNKTVESIKKVNLEIGYTINVLEVDESIFEVLNKGEGDNLKVSAFIDYRDGTFDGGTSSIEKRFAASTAPHWIKENCINCNICSLVCPHAVIRPFLLNDEEVNKAPEVVKDNLIDEVTNKNLKFIVSPSIPDCTGCGLCVNCCPGKMGNKALEMKPVEELLEMKKDEEYKFLFNEVSYKEHLPKTTVKGSQFRKPLFEFSGACAGCGETPYLKLLTQLFGENLVIANATGCSSIYSASLPTTAYKVPWANSLFEDNAEFGYGMKIADSLMKERIKGLLDKYKDKLDKEVVDDYISEVTLENSKQVYDLIKNSDIEEIKKYQDFIMKKTFFIVGGDGWAYDIGFSGIDHVLSNRDNVNILVLDTEVYSNTGGQSSKSSKTGSIAKFTAKGKENAKKDLAKIALTYPHVYVGTISLGANMNQALKVLTQAESYDGPSLIIAYSPCISHGILKGMDNTIEEEKQAVLSGYFPLFHYNPVDNKFTLDCKVDFDKYDEFLSGEDRYRMLKNINPDKFMELLKENKENAIERYKFYEELANKNS